LPKTIKTLLISVIIFFVNLSAQNPGDTVFSGDQILDFHFQFKQEKFLDSLYQSHEDEEYISVDVEIDGVFYDSVGVRFKGFSSYHAYPGDKKSLRIKFNKFKKSHRFDGMKKINLNNGWSDPTLLREKLYLDFLYKQDVTAPRVNFARVYLNDTYWGLYSLVEHVDKTFLETRFNNNDGNLYKAEKLADLKWKGGDQENYYDHYAIKTNETQNDWSDLVHLIDQLNNSDDDDFQSALENVLNTESFIKAWAANNLFINLDSYLGSANNFYIYSNEQFNHFDWIIWDVNLAFGSRAERDTLDIFYNEGQRPLIQRMLKEKEYVDSYLATIKDHLENGFSEEVLFPRIDTLFSLIKDDYFADTLKMYSNEQIVHNIESDIDIIPGLKLFITNRQTNITRQLDSLITSLSIKENVSKPDHFQLYQNYPNPFNPKTIIKYNLQMSNHISLTVYDISGRKIKTLINQQQIIGQHSVTFDASRLASGIYVYELVAGGEFIESKKMVLIR